jgi:hypothetical protein
MLAKATAALQGLIALAAAAVAIVAFGLTFSALTRNQNPAGPAFGVPALLFVGGAAYVAKRGFESARRIADGTDAPSSLFSGAGFQIAVCMTAVGATSIFGLGLFWRSSEKARAVEAFASLDALNQSQKDYFAKHAVYSDSIKNLELPASVWPPRSFDIGPIVVSSAPAPGWSVTLHREISVARYGAYSIIYDTSKPALFSCAGSENPAACRDELMPQ